MRKARKANKIVFGIASALLAATMITTSAISTTFAKYVSSSNSDTESARSAQWGGQVNDVWNGINTKIKPGTSGELIRISTSGVSEVAHKIDLEALLDVDAGYKRIDAGKDYFPILITVGVDGLVNINGRATDVYEKHFYMGMRGGAVDTVDELVEEIRACAASDEFSNIKVAPNQDAPLEFYVKWQWFYNDDEIDESSLDASIKTALKEYQSPEKDTLIGESMRIRAAFDAVLAQGGADTKLQTLKSVLANTKDKSDDQLTEGDVTALSEALAAVLGETLPDERYTYKREEIYDIRWTGVRNSKYMTCYDPNTTKITSYGDYFTLTSTDGYITSEARSEANKSGLELFYRSIPERVNGEIVANGATIPLREGFVYEYYFKARNNRDTGSSVGSAGVVFAIDAADKPYFLYGEFTNNSDTGEGKGAELDVRYNKFNSSVVNGTAETLIKLKTETIGGLAYGLYKIVYDGFNVTCYCMAEDGTYKPIGSSFTLPQGSRISVGVESREGYGNTERTVTVRDASFVQTKEVVSVKTVYGSLKSRAEAVIAACENGPFDIQADLNVTMQQILS